MPGAARSTLLLTRPEADSRRFAAHLPDLPAIIAPILRILPVAHDSATLAAAEGLVFTSAHAVAAAGPGRGRPAFCVGARTAEVARAAGFATVAGPGDAEGLAPMIASAGLRLIHPHGRHLARALPVEGMVVYDQQAQPLTPEAVALLEGAAPVIVPLFSPRSARLLAQAAQGARAPVWLAAISPAAMATWDARADRRAVAVTPDAAALAAAIRRLTDAEQS